MTSPTGGFDPQACAPGDTPPVAMLAAFVDETLCDTDIATGVVHNVVTRRTHYDDDGNFEGYDYFDSATGAPYVPLGEVTVCSFSDGPQVVILCEFKTDGSVVQFVRRYTELDNGQTLVGDSSLDGDQTFDVDPTSTVGLCPQVGTRDPIAVTGLCLPGGAPIAVVIRQDATGATLVDGYVSLLSGAFTPGAPPTGTVWCGTSDSVQVSGTFCSVDTATNTVLALVLVEYTYGQDGTIESTRLVNAVDGATYTVPVGAEITTCPSDVDAPDSDGIALCDDNGVFLRDYRRDENGALVSYTDYTLAATPYTAVGPVHVCAPDCCPQPAAEVCLANGHRGAVILADGVLSYVDVVTGLPFVVADIVPCDPFLNDGPMVLCYQGPGGADDVRQFVRHFTYGHDGSVTGQRDTTLDGGPVTVSPGAAFYCERADPVTYTEAFDVLPGTPWLFATAFSGSIAESVTVTVLSGTVTVDGSGTAPTVSLPVGTTMSWTRSAASGRLVGPTSITAAASSRAVVAYTATRVLP